MGFAAPPRLSQPEPLLIPPPPPIVLSQDDAARMTVQVRINGHGPYPFVIDTAADRTVISRELADVLNLPAGPTVLLHGTGGDDMTPTAKIDDLTVGDRSIHDISAPMLDVGYIGAAGMIGLDALAGQRIVMDLVHSRMAVQPSRPERVGTDVIVVRASSRYGQLILVDAAVDGIPVAVILDSGAQNSVGNFILRDLITHGGRLQKAGGEVISVTGRTTPARFSDLPNVRIGSFTLHHVPMAFADLHTFAQFEMNRRPAMLLGMDMVHLFDRVTVDFGRKEVRFQMPMDSAGSIVHIANAR